MTRSGKDILFGIDNITVSFEWTQGDGFSYSVTAIPSASVRFRGSTGAAVAVNYNTVYNISFIPSLCGQYGTPTSFSINFGEFANTDISS